MDGLAKHTDEHTSDSSDTTDKGYVDTTASELSTDETGRLSVAISTTMTNVRGFESEPEVYTSGLSRAITEMCRNTSFKRTFVCDFFRQVREYREYGTINTESSKHAALQIDTCLRQGRGDDCATQHFCSCTDHCPVFSNCCHNATTLDNIQGEAQREIALKLQHSSCEVIDRDVQIGWIIVSSCPKSWNDIKIKQQCEIRNLSDSLSLVPFYDPILEISYRNTFCAQCHRVQSSLKPWDVYFEHTCGQFSVNWKLNVIDAMNEALKSGCPLSVKPSASIKSTACFPHYVDDYSCFNHSIQNLLDTIASDWNSVSPGVGNKEGLFEEMITASAQHNVQDSVHRYLAYLCRQYHSLTVIEAFVFSRNWICNWCHQEKMRCADRIVVRSLTRFSALINFTAAISGRNKDMKCKVHELYDSLNMYCRPLFCPERLIAHDGICIPTFVKIQNIPITVSILLPCQVSRAQVHQIKLISRVLYYFRKLFIEHFQYVRIDMGGFLADHRVNRSILVSNITIKVCNIICRHMKLVSMTRFDDVIRLESILKIPFIEDPTLVGQFVPVKDGAFSSMCFNDTASTSCPYFKFNEEELARITNSTGCHFQVLTDFVPIYPDEDGYSICLDDYKRITSMACDSNHSATTTEGLISFILASLSLLALLFTVFTYIVNNDLHTVPCGICLNIMFALCVAYTLFILSSVFNDNSLLCHVTAVVSHYAWLSAFVSMLIYGCNLLRTFTSGIQANNFSNGQSGLLSRQLLVYVTVSQIVPALIICGNFVSMHFNLLDVQYGQPTCFINNPVALLISFGGPIMLVTGVNLTIFIITILKLCQMRASTSVQFKSHTNLLIPCVKMTTFLGLAWIFGILGAFTNFEFMWYAHTICNGSCGIVIFVSHVLLTKRVLQWYKYKVHNCLKDSG